jgi:hypothetical protein
MYLKIYCDGFYPYYDDVCRELFRLGYPIETNFLGSYRPEDPDGFYKHCSKPKSGNFVQFSFCRPSKFNKNFSAKSSIAHFANNKISWECEFKQMDKIIVSNSCSINDLKKHKVEVDLLNPYCEVFQYNKKNTGTFSYFTNCKWKEKSAWKELIVAYCRSFSPEDKVSLILMTDEDFDKVNRDIDVHLKINELSRHSSPQILVFDNREFKRAINYADIYISIDYGHEFDRKVLDCMASGVPVAVLKKDMYSDFCKKNSSFILDGVVSMERFFRNSRTNPNLVKGKSAFAKPFITSKCDKKKFFQYLEGVIQDQGVKSNGKMTIPSDELYSWSNERITI